MKKILVIGILWSTLILLTSIANCETLSYYNALHCEEEVNFVNNPFEELGKALYTSMITKKKIGMLILIEDPSEWEIVYKIQDVIKYYNLPITLFFTELKKEKK
jgi:hypothetical protein